MRRLPIKKTNKQKIIIEATFDYFGKEMTNEEKKSAKQIALYIMGRKRGVNLTEEEKSDMWAIRENLGDKVYVDSFKTNKDLET